MPLEIACFNAESALRAHLAGADRVELCHDQSVGGLTPSLSLFTSLQAAIPTPINVMIRPHGRSFVHSAEDISQMEADIDAFALAGAHGFVFGGLLTAPEGRVSVDEQQMRQLVSRAAGRPCTFHRAFDEVRDEDAEAELERVIACGFTSLLTSGGAASAVQGRERLRQLVQRADGGIEVIVGGGVRSGNVKLLLEATGASWFHSSGIVDGSDSASTSELRALRETLEA